MIKGITIVIAVAVVVTGIVAINTSSKNAQFVPPEPLSITVIK